VTITADSSLLEAVSVPPLRDFVLPETLYAAVPVTAVLDPPPPCAPPALPPEPPPGGEPGCPDAVELSLLLDDEADVLVLEDDAALDTSAESPDVVDDPQATRTMLAPSVTIATAADLR
jgi:hypothetical protein